jgi:anti-sigma regulatory factor (Ser/Thr protein kinase)
VAAARRFLTEVLAATGCLGFREDAELLISELATNAVIYGGGVIDVVVRACADGIWVGVTDSGQPYVWTPQLDPLSEGGRGLWLVDRIATSWGIEPAGSGRKTSWFWLDSRAHGHHLEGG